MFREYLQWSCNYPKKYHKNHLENLKNISRVFRYPDDNVLLFSEAIITIHIITIHQNMIFSECFFWMSSCWIGSPQIWIFWVTVNRISRGYQQTWSEWPQKLVDATAWHPTDISYYCLQEYYKDHPQYIKLPLEWYLQDVKMSIGYHIFRGCSHPLSVKMNPIIC